MLSLREAIKEIHDRVRQCFTRHQFATFGDVLSWWHEAPYVDKQMEAGEQGMPKFSADILWLISNFGPKTPVDHKVMDVRKLPSLKIPKNIVDDDVIEDTVEVAKSPAKRKKSPSTVKPPKRRKPRRRKF